MRQALAIVAGTLAAALGAVVLGEYDLRGATAVLGFPLYGLAVTELALAIAKRFTPPVLVVLAAVVAGGLSWALWISFGHFRNDVFPPPLSWVMVGGAAAATVAWGWSVRSGHKGPSGPAERGSQGPSGPAERGSQGPSGPAEPAEEEAHP